MWMNFPDFHLEGIPRITLSRVNLRRAILPKSVAIGQVAQSGFSLQPTHLVPGATRLHTGYQATDTGTHGDTNTVTIRLGDFDSGVPDGIDRRRDAIVHEGIHASGIA